MFDIFKDSKGKFNKKNILPLAGATIAGTMTALSTAGALHGFLAPALYSDWKWRDDYSYSHFLAAHIPMTIISISILSLLTYSPIDNIRKNKQIENLKANSESEEPGSFIYNALVNPISEEQSIV